MITRANNSIRHNTIRGVYHTPNHTNQHTCIIQLSVNAIPPSPKDVQMHIYKQFCTTQFTPFHNALHNATTKTTNYTQQSKYSLRSPKSTPLFMIKARHTQDVQIITYKFNSIVVTHNKMQNVINIMVQVSPVLEELYQILGIKLRAYSTITQRVYHNSGLLFAPLFKQI